MAQPGGIKRFWREVAIAQGDNGFAVTLDGRPVRTQVAGRPQQVPTRALAELLAAEWERVEERVDPHAFPARDLADRAIETVADNRDAAARALLRYAETDTLCYRAHPDEPLFAAQEAEWEPLVRGFEEREAVRLQRVSGIVHRPQPPATLARLTGRLAALDPFTLSAVGTMASLTASLVIALNALEAEADPDALWTAAELEEEWQADQWGRDAEAEARREARRGAFLAAARFARAARAG